MAGKAKQRTLSRETHEDLREAHAKKMATEAAQEIYAKRRHPGERPFAVIKQTFGARNFLLRGLKNVRQEWRWLASSFNLDRLMSLMRIRAGPTMANLRDIPFPLHPLQPDVHFQRR